MFLGTISYLAAKHVSERRRGCATAEVGPVLFTIPRAASQYRYRGAERHNYELFFLWGSGRLTTYLH